jgi:hypothetical protein
MALREDFFTLDGNPDPFGSLFSRRPELVDNAASMPGRRSDSLPFRIGKRGSKFGRFGQVGLAVR